MRFTPLLIPVLLAACTGVVSVLAVRAALGRTGRPRPFRLGTLWLVAGAFPLITAGFMILEKLGPSSSQIIGGGPLAASAAAGFLAASALRRITASLPLAIAFGVAAPLSISGGAGAEHLLELTRVSIPGGPWAESLLVFASAALTWHLLLALILVVWVRSDRNHHAFRYNHCTFCRYDVTGVQSHLCPECGRQHHARRLPSSRTAAVPESGTPGASL